MFDRFGGLCFSSVWKMVLDRIMGSRFLDCGGYIQQTGFGRCASALFCVLVLRNRSNRINPVGSNRWRQVTGQGDEEGMEKDSSGGFLVLCCLGTLLCSFSPRTRFQNQ